MKILLRKIHTIWCWSQVYMNWKSAQAHAKTLSNDEKDAYWEEQHSQFANQILKNIVELRGWWTKIGQFLSTRGDILPRQYVECFTKLQDDMPITSQKEIEEILNDELGSLRSEIKTIKFPPLASASIGQVHLGYLQNGDKIVVKVQHPEAEKLLEADMNNLEGLNWAFNKLESHFNFSSLIDEWRTASGDELDFNVEAKSQERIRKSFMEASVRVKVPKIYSNLTTRRVLVMEFIDGIKLSDQEQLKEENVDLNSVFNDLIDSFAYQLFVEEFFHGDPHPGNILIAKEGDHHVPVLLDWGLIKWIPEHQRKAYAKLVFAVENMDTIGFMESLVGCGVKFKQDSFMDPEYYLSYFAKYLGGKDVRNCDITDLKFDTANAYNSGLVNKDQIMSNNPISDWPKNVIMLLRTATLLHGISSSLVVDVDVTGILMKRARQGLIKSQSFPDYSIKPKNSLEANVLRLLNELRCENLVLGAAVVVLSESEILVNACTGQMGDLNTKKVDLNSLFAGLSLTQGFCVLCLLILIDRNMASLDDNVCHWLDGFIRFGKKDMKIRHILSHTAGLEKALPTNMTIARLCDSTWMGTHYGYVNVSNPPGSRCRYSYLSYAWIVSELVFSISGMTVEEMFLEEVILPLNLSNEVIFGPMANDCTLDSNDAERSQEMEYGKARTFFNKFISGESSLFRWPKRNDKNEINSDGYRPDANKSPLAKDMSRKKEKSSDVNTDINQMNFSSNESLPKLDSDSSSVQSFNPFSGAGSIRTDSFETEFCTNFSALHNLNEDTIIESSKKMEGQYENLHTIRKGIGRYEEDQLNHNSPVQSPISETKISNTSETNALQTVDFDRFVTITREIKFALSRGDPIALLSETLSFLNSNDEEMIPAKTCSPAKIFLKKPHILDPLLFNHPSIVSKRIPPLNSRFTALGIAKIYQAMCNGELISHNLLTELMSTKNLDPTAVTALLTGGHSSSFCLGYQALEYQCNGQERIGFGMSDYSGSLVFTLPDSSLTISILLNDINSGPMVSSKLLKAILHKFGCSVGGPKCSPFDCFKSLVFAGN